MYLATMVVFDPVLHLQLQLPFTPLPKTDLGEQAAQHFREANVPDTAVHTLDKIAKTVEVYTPSRAVQLYLKVTVCVIFLPCMANKLIFCIFALFVTC